jgi:hypothetical protein
MQDKNEQAENYNIEDSPEKVHLFTFMHPGL